MTGLNIPADTFEIEVIRHLPDSPDHVIFVDAPDAEDDQRVIEAMEIVSGTWALLWQLGLMGWRLFEFVPWDDGFGIEVYRKVSQ